MTLTKHLITAFRLKNVSKFYIFMMTTFIKAKQNGQTNINKQSMISGFVLKKQNINLKKKKNSKNIFDHNYIAHLLI